MVAKVCFMIKATWLLMLTYDFWKIKSQDKIKINVGCHIIFVRGNENRIVVIFKFSPLTYISCMCMIYRPLEPYELTTSEHRWRVGRECVHGLDENTNHIWKKF